ncbi:putative MFS family arabinose efflux permease [Pseudonocardia hierapolitana]|uniref:Putative MFS family arabinose efflux permease n=1 Tax=Pseudonocardia hierapolitana TaxID=1128676 RepID=A0A561SHK3_9PSEU|nr:MFS transporter [Pseudonocardia hierapolitana]TWF74340.1 putative MFS family arabinose efflux permease [Pseudonocardia hierapolitana]
MSLWRHRDFLLLWAGETVSQVGTMVSHLALPLLAATSLGATAWEMGLLVAAERGAFLLVGLPAGVLMDRVRRRPVMIAADLVRFALFASIPPAWAFGVLTFAQLLVVALLAGVATVFFDVGYQSVLPAVVGRAGLVDGNAKLESTRAAAETAGPALGGGLVQLVGAAAAVLLDAVTYLVSAAFLLRMRTREAVPARDPARSLRAEMAEGMRYVLGHPLLRPITLCTGTANLFGGVLAAVSVLFLARELSQPPAVIGLVLAAGSAGGVLGALTSGRWIRVLGQGRTVVISLLVTGPVALVLPLATPGAGLGWFALGMAAVAYGGVVYNVAQVSFRQAVTPDRLLGRMNASIRFLVWGTIPLGGLLGGALGELLGLRATLLIAAVGTVLSPVWVVASPLRRLRDLPDAVPQT